MSRWHATPLFIFIFTVTTVAAALAVPTRLAQQGRLLDGAGDPLEGTHALRFTLYDAAVGGTSVWTEDHAAELESGDYSVALGSQAPLDDLLFANGALWLELIVDGEALSPRQEIVSVPYALRATAAEHLEGGSVDAQEISIDGTVVIDSAGNWVGPSPDVSWGDLDDVPTDLADGDQDTITTTLDWSAITGIPADLADGDQDTITPGPTGPQGAVGPTGLQGITGTTGLQGITGPIRRALLGDIDS